MKIIGDKIILRAIEPQDRDMFLELINDPETEKMVGGMSFPVSTLEQERWIDNQAGNKNILRCVIAAKEDEGHGLGTVILSDLDYKNGTAQLHIKMSPNGGRRKGYGSDAIKTLTNYAFDELRLNCIYAEILNYNLPSQHLFDKCGFTRDGELRARVYKAGKYVNILSYSLLKTDRIGDA